MTDDFEYVNRGGGPLSILALLTALSILGVAAWQPIPMSIWLVLVPVMAICIWQVSVSPIYGIRLSDRVLHVLEGYRDRSYPLSRIAHLRICERGEATRYTLVMKNGDTAQIPSRAMPNALDLIREATGRGIPVRHG